MIDKIPTWMRLEGSSDTYIQLLNLMLIEEFYESHSKKLRINTSFDYIYARTKGAGLDNNIYATNFQALEKTHFLKIKKYYDYVQLKKAVVIANEFLNKFRDQSFGWFYENVSVTGSISTSVSELLSGYYLRGLNIGHSCPTTVSKDSLETFNYSGMFTTSIDRDYRHYFDKLFVLFLFDFKFDFVDQFVYTKNKTTSEIPLGITFNFTHLDTTTAFQDYSQSTKGLKLISYENATSAHSMFLSNMAGSMIHNVAEDEALLSYVWFILTIPFKINETKRYIRENFLSKTKQEILTYYETRQDLRGRAVPNS